MTTTPHRSGGNIQLHCGDCRTVMATLAEASVDLVLADLPYGTTACAWDQVIPFDELWPLYRRVLKPRGAVVLTASQPFTSMAVMSNRDWFRFDDVWDKVNRYTGFLDAKRRPLRKHETILVFSPSGRFTYNAQMGVGEPYRASRSGKSTQVYREFAIRDGESNGERYPCSIVSIEADTKAAPLHPTQKPVALMEYLTLTYSNEGDTVLDNTMGSGTTGVACVNTGRNFVGIELDPATFRDAEQRIADARLRLDRPHAPALRLREKALDGPSLFDAQEAHA